MTQTPIIPGDVRQPVGFLTYSADADAPSPLRPLGPTTLGPNDHVYPVTQERGEKLRIGFSFIAPGMTLVATGFDPEDPGLSPMDRATVQAAKAHIEAQGRVLR